MGEFVCLTADEGKLIWAADQFKDTDTPNPAFGKSNLYWGVAVSPLVEGDLVIIQPGGKPNKSVVAYHKDTGKIVWSAGDDLHNYGSPMAYTIGGERILIVPTGDSVLGLEPTKGKILWRYALADKYRTTCATPVLVHNMLWMSTAYEVGCAVVELAVQDGKWKVTEKWKNKKSLQTLYGNAMIVTATSTARTAISMRSS